MGNGGGQGGIVIPQPAAGWSFNELIHRLITVINMWRTGAHGDRFHGNPR